MKKPSKWKAFFILKCKKAVKADLIDAIFLHQKTTFQWHYQFSDSLKLC